MEKENLVQSIAAAGVLVMGEGDEQTPLAVVTGVKQVVFQKRPPTAAELRDLKISMADDAFAPLLVKAGWKRGCG